jgi:hypothetical protein
VPVLILNVETAFRVGREFQVRRAFTGFYGLHEAGSTSGYTKPFPPFTAPCKFIPLTLD